MNISAEGIAGRIMALAREVPQDESPAQRDKILQDRYDAWSQGYDPRHTARTYWAPAHLARLASLYLPKGAGPLLDAASGTGLLGAALRAQGFAELIAVDVSAEMLQLAQEKAVYSSILQASLHEPLPLAKGSLAGALCCGAFYEGIVEVPALGHLLPLIRPGGHFICDVELEAWETRGFRDVFRTLEAEGWLTLQHAEPFQMFLPAHLGPEIAPDAPQGMAIVARLGPG